MRLKQTFCLFPVFAALAAAAPFEPAEKNEESEMEVVSVKARGNEGQMGLNERSIKHGDRIQFFGKTFNTFEEAADNVFSVDFIRNQIFNKHIPKSVKEVIDGSLEAESRYLNVLDSVNPLKCIEYCKCISGLPGMIYNLSMGYHQSHDFSIEVKNRTWTTTFKYVVVKKGFRCACKYVNLERDFVFPALVGGEKVCKDDVTEEEASENTPDDSEEEGSENTPENSEEEASENTPDNSEEEAPENTPNNMQTTTATPDNSEEEASESTPDNSEEEASESTSDNSEEEASESTPDNSEEEAPEKTTKKPITLPDPEM